jgi:hypothetical protein
MTGLGATQTDRFIRHLRTRFNISTLVETGTDIGVSTAHAAGIFERVVTIDIRADHRMEAKNRCAGYSNVEFREGDSRDVLADVITSLDRPSLFWLDAHAAPGLYGERDDWPAVDEINIINRSALLHCSRIDDAHCFGPGSPYPACPTLAQIEDAALIGGYACQVAHDVIVLLPWGEAEEFVYFT